MPDVTRYWVEHYIDRCNTEEVSRDQVEDWLVAVGVSWLALEARVRELEQEIVNMKTGPWFYFGGTEEETR